MYPTTKYIPGEHNAVCDYCQITYKASQLRKTWNGFLACPKDYDPKHPALTPPKPVYGENRPVQDARDERHINQEVDIVVLDFLPAGVVQQGDD